MSQYVKIPDRSSGGGGAEAFAAMSGADPDVVALWNFDETTGTTFTDSVNSVDLVATGTSSIATYYNYGINNYQIAGGGALQNIAPGVCMQQNTLATATGQDAVLGNGTGSHTFEFYYACTADDSTAQFARTDATAIGQLNFWFNRAGYIFFRIFATDGSNVTCQTATDPALYNMTTGQVRHLRFVYDAGVSMSIYLDGVLARTVDASALSGKTLEIDKFTVAPTSIATKGTILYQVRISHNATNDGYVYG